MSDNKKPDKDHSGSGGDDDGNRFNLSNQQSVEEILPYLWWLIFIVATTSFLALQLFLDAIYEEQYERDVAWIARQSKYMSSVDEDDEDYEDDEDVDDDDDAFYDDDEDEELENLMDGDSEDEEEEMNVEMDAGATSLLDLATCASLPKTTMDRGNENADEEVEMEEEEEEEEDEMGNLDGEEKKNPDSANGSSP
ncbi:tumor rejection antigen P815A-like isoform X2 [Mastomys coucha]|uniref:tumor rejection antigen P815A-like isoform X2 n=1 Tax=Mastomys coucha TaxID=35658 RepID=UPI0012615CE7|nr:tumor rejection antigen P815A-like isoform X2 [Mastomys coucha]